MAPRLSLGVQQRGGMGRAPGDWVVPCPRGSAPATACFLLRAHHGPRQSPGPSSSLRGVEGEGKDSPLEAASRRGPRFTRTQEQRAVSRLPTARGPVRREVAAWEAE